jgi:hypothetical protein
MAQEQKYVIEIMGYFHEPNFKVDSLKYYSKFALRFTTPNLGCKQIVCCNFNLFFLPKLDSFIYFLLNEVD